MKKTAGRRASDGPRSNNRKLWKCLARFRGAGDGYRGLTQGTVSLWLEKPRLEVSCGKGKVRRSSSGSDSQSPAGTSTESAIPLS